MLAVVSNKIYDCVAKIPLGFELLKEIYKVLVSICDYFTCKFMSI